jgi:hypothetical protein
MAGESAELRSMLSIRGFHPGIPNIAESGIDSRPRVEGYPGVHIPNGIRVEKTDTFENRFVWGIDSRPRVEGYPGIHIPNGIRVEKTDTFENRFISRENSEKWEFLAAITVIFGKNTAIGVGLLYTRRNDCVFDGDISFEFKYMKNWHG